MSYVLRLPDGRFITQCGPNAATSNIRKAKKFACAIETEEFANAYLGGTRVQLVDLNGRRALAGDYEAPEVLKTVGKFKTRNNDLVRVNFASIVRETPMAYLLAFDGKWEPVEQWIPKSLVRDLEDDHFYTFQKIAGEYNRLERSI